MTAATTGRLDDSTNILCSFPSACATAARINSLQLFQNVVELEESVRMMKEITVKTKQDKHGQTKVGSLTFEQIMQTWRVRTVLMDRWMGVGGNGCDWV